MRRKPLKLMAWLIKKKAALPIVLVKKDKAAFITLEKVKDAWRSENFITATETASKLEQNLGQLEPVNSIELLESK